MEMHPISCHTIGAMPDRPILSTLRERTEFSCWCGTLCQYKEPCSQGILRKCHTSRGSLGELLGDTSLHLVYIAEITNEQQVTQEVHFYASLWEEFYLRDMGVFSRDDIIIAHSLSVSCPFQSYCIISQDNNTPGYHT